MLPGAFPRQEPPQPKPSHLTRRIIGLTSPSIRQPWEINKSLGIVYPTDGLPLNFHHSRIQLFLRIPCFMELHDPLFQNLFHYLRSTMPGFARNSPPPPPPSSLLSSSTPSSSSFSPTIQTPTKRSSWIDDQHTRIRCICYCFICSMKYISAKRSVRNLDV